MPHVRRLRFFAPRAQSSPDAGPPATEGSPARGRSAGPPPARRTPMLRYALELAVVFLGVSLSLAAEEWRQARTLRADEETSLGRIVEDLRIDIEDLRGNLERAEAGRVGALWLRKNWDRADLPEDSVAAAVRDLFEISIFVPNASEYTALRSAGRVNIIQDAELRRSLTLLYERHPLFHELHRLDEQRRAQLSLRLGSSFTPASSEQLYPLPPFEPVNQWHDLLQDPGFRRDAHMSGVIKQWLVWNIQGQIRSSQEAIEQIEATLAAH